MIEKKRRIKYVDAQLYFFVRHSGLMACDQRWCGRWTHMNVDNGE